MSLKFNYTRKFIDQDQAEAFLNNLSLDHRKFPQILSKIAVAEQSLKGFDASLSTLVSTNYRNRDCSDDKDRWDLRRQIISELLTLPRLENDDKIILGEGGALPNCGIRNEKKAYIIIGLPTSGKSTISNIIAEEYGSIILDSDFAKRKLPEYPYYPAGATILHDESDAIVNGFVENPYEVLSVYEHSLLNHYNLIIPKVGHRVEGIRDLASVLVEAEYEVHLILVSLKREESAKRAVERLDKTSRYIPLGLIFDGYANNPLLTYYILRVKFNDLFTSFGAISTTNKQPICIDYVNNSPCKSYPFNPTMLF